MNVKTLILIVEDEPTICNFIASTLNANGYKVIKSHTGKEACSLISSYCPELVLLDLGLPDMDGLQVIKKVREWSQVPIIVVSARNQEKEKVQALDMGADDYITKPFGTSELLARIRTELRHHAKINARTEQVATSFVAKDLVIDYTKRLVMVDGNEVHMTKSEFKLLTLLSNNAGKVLTYDWLIEQIWGPYAIKDNQILRVNMANIRRKIEKNPADPQYIFTEVGVGYRMVEEDESKGV